MGRGCKERMKNTGEVNTITSPRGDKKLRMERQPQERTVKRSPLVLMSTVLMTCWGKKLDGCWLMSNER